MAENSILSFDNINMPFSLEAEQAVLGSILVDSACLSQAAVYISPDSFYLPQHQAIFSAMILADGSGMKIDPLVILEQLVQQGVYDNASGRTNNRTCNRDDNRTCQRNHARGRRSHYGTSSSVCRKRKHR